jgi:uncharacterized protein (TIGR03437 family)
MRFLLACLLGLSVTSIYAADGSVRPAIHFSKIYGGSDSDDGNAIAVDASGNIYVAGTTASADFPVTNALQPGMRGIPLRASTDAGKTWTTPSIPEPVYAVAASAAAPSVVYAGTSASMYKSGDAGKTWNRLQGFGPALVNALAADPTTAGTVYAGTSTGVWKSTDSGATWSRTDSGQFVLALAMHSSRPATLAAAVQLNIGPTQPSLYRTTDGGATWTVLPNSPIGPYALAFDAANPDVLYAAASTAGFAGGGTAGVYKSADGGGSWVKLTGPSPAISTFAVAAGAGTVYVSASAGVMVSGDAGSTWKTAPVRGVAAGNVAVDPTHPQTVYADGDGVFVSNDAGATWSSVLPNRAVNETIAVVPTTPPTVFIGGGYGTDLFITKWSSDGKQMLYSTYLGSSYYDYATGIAVDRQGNAYVTGYTYGTDFPVTAGAAQTKNGGTYNVFLSKISPDGKTLLYSSYLGGSNRDAGFAVAVDNSGNAYLTGYTNSLDFPVTTGAAQTSMVQRCIAISATPTTLPSGDAFVAKIATDGSGLKYATYLGGTCADEGLGIAVDASGSAYVVGATESYQDFPTTAGALQPTRAVGNILSGFLAKLNPQGSGISYATYLGGPGDDTAWSVAVDDKGGAYVSGTSQGFDQVIYQPQGTSFTAPNQPKVGFAAALGGAAYVMKLDPTGSKREWLKYLGGTGGRASSLALDGSGSVWTAGTAFAGSWSEPFPTLHPAQALVGNGFLSKLGTDGTLQFSTMLDAAQQVALDAAGNAYVAGSVADPSKSFASTSVLFRFDSAVPSPVTIETPQRAVPPEIAALDRGVAAGEIAVLTGTGLGPAQPVGAQLDQTGRLATTLAGTTVTFDGVPAPLISVGAQKIAVMVPFAVAQSIATVVQVHSGGSDSNSILLPTAPTAVEALAVTNADGSLNSARQPAAPGSIVTIYAAGLGPNYPPSADGAINGTEGRTLQEDAVGVKVAGQDAQIVYIGPAPGQVAGVTQINIRLTQLPAGRYTGYVGWGALSSASNDQHPFADYGGIPIVVGQP